MKRGGKGKMNEKEMAEGYKAMAEEQKQFADMVSKIEREVIAEYKGCPRCISPHSWDDKKKVV
jgi:hypothetical protein